MDEELRKKLDEILAVCVVSHQQTMNLIGITAISLAVVIGVCAAVICNAVNPG